LIASYLLKCDPSQYPSGFDVFPQPHVGLSILVEFIFFIV
jgi:hypothetical protein